MELLVWFSLPDVLILQGYRFKTDEELVCVDTLQSGVIKDLELSKYIVYTGSNRSKFTLLKSDQLIDDGLKVTNRTLYDTLIWLWVQLFTDRIHQASFCLAVLCNKMKYLPVSQLFKLFVIIHFVSFPFFFYKCVSFFSPTLGFLFGLFVSKDGSCICSLQLGISHSKIFSFQFGD